MNFQYKSFIVQSISIFFFFALFSISHSFFFVLFLHRTILKLYSYRFKIFLLVQFMYYCHISCQPCKNLCCSLVHCITLYFICKKKKTNVILTR